MTETTETTTQTTETRAVDEIRAELARAETAERERAQRAAQEQAAEDLAQARRVWAGWQEREHALADEERQAGQDQDAAGEAADLPALLEAMGRATRARNARRALRDRATRALNTITDAAARDARAAAEPGQEDHAEALSRQRQPAPPAELRYYETDPWPAFIAGLNKRAESDGYARGEDLADQLGAGHSTEGE